MAEAQGGAPAAQVASATDSAASSLSAGLSALADDEAQGSPDVIEVPVPNAENASLMDGMEQFDVDHPAQVQPPLSTKCDDDRSLCVFWLTPTG